MRITSGKLISLMAGTVALIIFISSQFFSETTTAQPSFVGSLPAGYTAYSSQLSFGKACSCSTGGITGAPAGAPPCEITPCFGSSRTRYGWVKAKTAGVSSTACEEIKQKNRTIAPCFQLDGDDALVISGSMSPIQDLTYYGFALYQTLTYDNQYESNYAGVLSSINLGLNKSNLKMGNNGKYVVIVAANTKTINVVKQALRATGVPDAVMNTYLAPNTVMNVGSSSYPDQISFALRLSFQSDTEMQQVNTFVQQNGAATNVVFVKGPGIKGDVTFNNLPKWEDKLRVNKIEYITHLDKYLNALEAAIRYDYAQKGYAFKARITESLLHVDPNQCRSTSTSCVYDSPDALYSSFPCDFSTSILRNDNCQIELGATSKDTVMWIGVDHSLVGDKTLASYWSGESQALKGGNDGTFSFVGLYTQGSAKQYWQSDKVNSLYAIKITRNCGNQPFCAAVPFIGTTADRVGFAIVGRTYLDKVAGTGPNPANLVPARLLWFTKNS